MLKFLLTVQELKCSSLVALSCKVHLSVAHFWRATMCCIYGNQPMHACGPAADLDVMHTHTHMAAHTHTHVRRTHTRTHGMHTCTCEPHVHTHTHTHAHKTQVIVKTQPSCSEGEVGGVSSLYAASLGQLLQHMPQTLQLYGNTVGGHSSSQYGYNTVWRPIVQCIEMNSTWNDGADVSLHPTSCMHGELPVKDSAPSWIEPFEPRLWSPNQQTISYTE